MNEATLEEKAKEVVIQGTAILAKKGDSLVLLKRIVMDETIYADTGQTDVDREEFYEITLNEDIIRKAIKAGYQNGGTVNYRIIIKPKISAGNP